MSGLVYEDDKGFVSFGKYLLSESISPKKVDYGINSDLDDRKWDIYQNIGSSFKSTFTKLDNNYYMVSIQDDGEIFFLTSLIQDIDTTRLSDKRYVNTYFDFKRIKTRQIIMVLNGLLYVFLEGLSNAHIKEVKFSAVDPSLGTAYSFIVDNKFFQKRLRDLGYDYVGKIDDKYYTFKRI